MATVTLTIPRGPVTSELKYYKPPDDGSAPYYYAEQRPEGVPALNFGMESHVVAISDMRGKESEFHLDKNAFQILRNIESEERDFDDDEHIKRVYYPEVEKLILDHVAGAHRVVIFGHTIRKSSLNAARSPVSHVLIDKQNDQTQKDQKQTDQTQTDQTQKDQTQKAAATRPVYHVHVDQTPNAAASRVRLHVPDDAEKLLQGRYRIINTWRPINGPVYSDPLGLADATTIDDEDLVTVKRISPDRTGETVSVKYNPNHQWHYLSGMTNDERLLIKIFDSDGKVGKSVPHTAFKDPRSPPEAPGRESIEVRALVFG